MGVRPGMTVYEMEAGEGYYTELLSTILGAEGHLYMQNPPGFDSFLGDSVADRLRDNRLPNVTHDKTSFDRLNVADASVDIVTWILGPHELYFVLSDGVSLGAIDATYAEIFRILKPGGSFIVLDHAAAPGTSEESGQIYHRIDPAIVRALIIDAGLVFESESNILRNDTDIYEKSVFDPSIRRKTDRFLFRFRKPE